MFTIKRCSLIRGVHYERFHCTYKFKRAFFRHDRRTAPKFGTHVRIETRLALTKKKLTNPTPEGFRGLLIDVCGMWHVGCLWHDSSRW